MNTPYLIQRAHFCYRDKPGIDGLLRFDYMGSAEFEFGALPKSLNRIRESINDYIVECPIINSTPVNVLCKKNNFDDVFDFLELLSKKEHPMMKEQPRFYTFVNNIKSKYPSMDIDHWWDIENDFMFWRKKNGFNQKFFNAIGFKGAIK